MTAIILLIICLLASSVGAIVGAGGGVIIKPVLDMLGILPVSTVSFCSGCTVLGMSVCSLIRNRNDGVKLQIKTSTALAIGAVIGGVGGALTGAAISKRIDNKGVEKILKALLIVIIMIDFYNVLKFTVL